MSIVGACVLPHPPLIAGKVSPESRKAMVKKTIEAFHRVAREIAQLKPETLVISSPHAPLFTDFFHISAGPSALGDFSPFGDTQTRLEADYDEELVAELADLCQNADFPAGPLDRGSTALDHGVSVPLYFINQYYSNYKLLRLGLSGLSLNMHRELGLLLAKALEQGGRRAFYIASGDLSHKLLPDGPYGFAKEGPEYDARVMQVLSSNKLDELFNFDESFLSLAAECGHRSFCIMAGCLEGLNCQAEKLAYEGPFGVGYGAVLYTKRN
jgi:AmmeMemoRadiSam system protein B